MTKSTRAIIIGCMPKSTWRTLVRLLAVGLLCLGLLAVLTREWPDRTTDDYLYSSSIHNRRFDFIAWEVNALGSKAIYSLAPPHSYLDPDKQKDIVLRYFDQLREVQRIEGQIVTMYADPAISDPDSATAELDHQLGEARTLLERLQPLAEGILEEQIAAVLADQGITLGGRTFPPVKLHFTPLPAMLVISPRDRIEAIRFFPLEHGLDIPERVEIESAVEQALNVSSLVTNIGGLAAYPSMMLESSSFNWVIDTGAHEWTHHYLTLHPLGVLYDTDPQLRTMNETVASIVGREVGAEVVRRYYPEFVPPPPPPAPAEPAPTPEPPSFDFRAEMRKTRLHVDGLLAQGRIEDAEAYMEARRQLFWENGYRIRRLNQAYFSFHGAYADQPGSQGADPVGPAVVALRTQSASLQDFLRTVAPLTSFAELEEILNR